MQLISFSFEKPKTKVNWLFETTLIAFLVFSIYFVYNPSLTGPFILDDESCLSKISVYSGLETWEQIYYFITKGGQTLFERPLSYLSFLIDDYGWPSTPKRYRATNISIHAINTLLVLWISLKLIRIAFPSIEQGKAALLAWSISILWALHPIHVNTVAYIIQRMTLLSGTFTFSGLLFYLQGRDLLAEKNNINGLVWMSLSVIIFMPLAFLCKQTGVLLPLYILAAEAVLLKNIPDHNKAKRWGYIFIGTPVSITIATLTLKAHEKVFQWYDAMPFSPLERILTESRILWEYIFLILIPRAHSTTLFHDNYQISHSLYTPPTTLISILAWITILSLAIAFRNRTRLLLFAITWFLFGHLLESTIIGLELYFEHRNYLPSFGILFALVLSLYLIARSYIRLFIFMGTIYICLTAFVGYINTTKWRSYHDLITAWYNDNPDSIRTIKSYTGLLDEKGSSDRIYKILKDQQRKTPDSAEISLLLLLRECLDNTVTQDSLDTTLSHIPQRYLHSNTLPDIIKSIHNGIVSGNCTGLTLDDLEIIINHLLQHPLSHNAQRSQKWAAMTVNLYLRLAEIGKQQGDLNKAITSLDHAYKVWPTPSILILKMRWLQSAGLNKQALETAHKALSLSKQWALFPNLNPYENFLTTTISELEKSFATSGYHSSNTP